MLHSSSSENPLVSVITPVYNGVAYIHETIASVLNQTYKNWEMIVVDDCSTDATCNLVRSYIDRDKRIRLITLDINNGAPAIPRNIGISRAGGEWIALLDADDVWHPSKLQLQMELMLENNFIFSSTKMTDFSESEQITFKENPDKRYQNISFLGQQIKGKIPASSVVARKHLFIEFPFEESIEYKAVEDYHCWLRIHEKYGSSVKLIDPLLFYRKTDEQISKSKFYMLKKIYMVHKKYRKYSFFRSILFTITHLVSGFYYRFIRKGL